MLRMVPYCSFFLALLLLLLAGTKNAKCALLQDSSSAPVCEDDIVGDAIVTDLIEWIKENGGIVDDRQVVQRGDVFSPTNVVATSFIPEGTVLLSIPWALVVDSEDEHTSNICQLVDHLHKELEAHDRGESDNAPYMRYLEWMADPIKLPTAWTRGGKDLLTAVMGETISREDYIDDHFMEWMEKCNVEDSVAKAQRKAALLVIGYWSPEPPSDGEEDWYQMMPFYDLYSPREDSFNAIYTGDEVEEVMLVIASQDIQAGEKIHTPIGFGETHGAERQFIHSGILERRHSFTFMDPSAPRVYEDLNVVFDFDRVETNGKVVHNVTWVKGVRPHSRSFDFAQAELNRLKRVAKLLSLDELYLLFPLKDYEKRAVEAFTLAQIDALSAFLETRHDPRPVTPWTQIDYKVAGVNLGTYNLDGIDEAKKAEAGGEERYELFEDFDIGDRIIGNENWRDMIEYRRHLDRPSLSFYVDKVARKRWLPTQGMPQAKQHVLQYGFELSESGDTNEAEVLYKLIPDEADYAAKPSHHSEGVSVWLVSHDTENNTTSFSSTARQLELDTNGTFDKMNVAEALANHLRAEATDQESLTLRNVKPGVVVEERFVEVDEFSQAPIEFNCFVIWGRIWVAQLNIINKDRRKAKTWIHRDGSPIEGAEELPSEMDYIDWPRVVEIAETLGRNKDMFRVDIFVGLPASSPSLQGSATREERLAAVEYAVNECEIYPTTNFRKWPQLAQDGARLWVAGYKMGNYRTVPNTEIPKEFLENGGSLPQS